MVEMCNAHGLAVLRQFDSWDNGRFCMSNDSLGKTADVVTVFEKDVTYEDAK
jgi:hypothetical protein